MLLRALGHHVTISTPDQSGWEGCDVFIALHARKSHAAVMQFWAKNPHVPILLALTGTDLYQDLPKHDRKALESIRLADRLIILQRLAAKKVPRSARHKVRVLYQSVQPVRRSQKKPEVWKDLWTKIKISDANTPFVVCTLGHLRAVKDPLRAAMAVRQLPAASRLHVVQIGQAVTPVWGRRAEREMHQNPRYHWVGLLPHAQAIQILLRSQLLVLTSRSEGGANAIMEAIACGVPVISSRMDGSVGILGESYPGYFPVGDTIALRRLLMRCETDHLFYESLQSHVQALQPLTEPERECRTWQEILAELHLAYIDAK
jgi:putative glycosyltransferase (TIGR04348 family)